MPRKDPAERRAYHAGYREKNQAKLRPQTRSRQRKYRTGWAREEVELAFKQQEGKCWVCQVDMNFVGSTPPRPTDMCADHDHSTGKKRALLCQNCNFLEGLLKNVVPGISFESLVSRVVLYWTTFK